MKCGSFEQHFPKVALDRFVEVVVVVCQTTNIYTVVLRVIYVELFVEVLDIRQVLYQMVICCFQIFDDLVVDISVEYLSRRIYIIVVVIFRGKQIRLPTSAISLFLAVVIFQCSIQISQYDVRAEYHGGHDQYVVEEINVYLLTDIGNIVKLRVQSVLCMTYFYLQGIHPALIVNLKHIKKTRTACIL